MLVRASSLDAATVSGIVEMAWADEVDFESISHQFGLSEPAVIRLMRRHLKPPSFKRWRRRVAGRASKHSKRAFARSL
jgi:uncharacterized protein (TIGR03643 family)